jgi:hypothetical protein
MFSLFVFVFWCAGGEDQGGRASRHSHVCWYPRGDD